LLTLARFGVTRRRSRTRALEHLLKHDVALALVDVQMPVMDGFELAELMRGTERTRRVPIIFLTAGTADRQRRFRGYEAGAVDFLHKPIEHDILKSKADVFFELYRQREEVACQRDELRIAMDENARLLEASRQNAAALKEADHRKDEFLATLAHELRNPLAPILNGLEVIKPSHNSGKGTDHPREMISRQIRDMVRLIDDLLDVSRFTSGKVILKRQHITIKFVVEMAVEASRPLIEAGKHELKVNLLDDDIIIDADPTRISQVLSNLLNNAAKYTLDGGLIELTVARHGGEVSIGVRDSGVGLSTEMLPRVFELFTQVGRSLDRSQGGLGIGLALVKKLLELHSGSVVATSDGLGKGSTFPVKLPLPEHTGHLGLASKSQIHRESEAAVRRILIVDDNKDGVESLRLLLELFGHRIQTASDGPGAFSRAIEFKPEVIFLDIGLPGLNGYEVARKLRSEPLTAKATLIAHTGWGTEDDRRMSKQAGFDFHLTKPVDAAQVNALLAKI
jgi:signal transduction histidine kinase